MFGTIRLDTVEQNKQNIGNKAPNYKDGRTLKRYCCIDCKKELTHYSYKRCISCAIKYLWTNPEYRSKIMHPRYNYKGKNHHNYIHGKGNTPYSLEFSNTLKYIIRERDNFICQCCGLKEKDHYRNLDVHHIDYNKDNCNKNNLITTCNVCNLKANYNRDYWFAYYSYIMENYIYE